MRQHLLISALAIAAVTIASCDRKGAGRGSDSTATSIDTAQLAPPATTHPADTTAAQNDTAEVVTHTAVISTSTGDIEVELYGKDASKTVENFVGLAKKGYYDGVAFHRVIPGFMIQTGDPNSRDTANRGAWGNGGESIYGKEFEDELNPNSPSGRRGYSEGTLAMANSGPNTNGSQFFIVLTTEGAKHLDYKYTIFGHVRSGMDVVRKIGETGRTGEMPLHPATIRTVTVKEDGK
jgi:cyclophilin family peptidyl-prolyl cis-trans isomerase